MIRNAIENQVVALATLGEIRLGIVNDLIGADGSDHVNISCAANAGHVSSERLRDLHSKRAHASRRTVNQNLPFEVNLPVVAQSASPKPLQCGQSRNRYRSRLLKRHVRRLQNHFFFGGEHILCKGPTAGAEYLIAWFELLDVPAYRFHMACHIHAKSLILWFSHTSGDAKWVRYAAHKVPVIR